MIQSIVVIGAGTMGNGISHVFAQYGYKVTIVDIAQASLDKGLTTITNNLSRQVKKGTLTEEQMSATLANITLSTDLASVAPKANLIIEAASEDINVKKKIFTQLDGICPETTIFATNTSSISITDLAAVTNRADKFIGMHFFNPVPVMKLVELIRGIATSNETYDVIHSLSLAIEKVPVSVQDYPGFISNRVLMPMINEAIYCLMEGVASAEDIDTVMKLGMAHPMGPLTLADFIGLDVCLAIMEVLHNGYSDSKYRPCPLLRKMVAAGYMGRKSGKGFFTY
jgi:3-hydroxybutyryl-CoA dehydrogenase